MEPARLPRRIGAYLLDNLLGQASFGLAVLLLGVLLGERGPLWPSIVALELCLVVLPYAIVPALMQGRTLGQRALGLHLVTADGQPASPLASAARGLLKVHLTVGCGQILLIWALIGGRELLLPGVKAGRYVRFPHDALTGTVVVHAPGGLPALSGGGGAYGSPTSSAPV